MEAYFFYMEMAVVRFYYEVQKWFTLYYTVENRKCNWVAKVVRIRQPDCKFGPQGSGSSPLLPTNKVTPQS